ncbi:MAG: hypothetical protein ACTSR9_17540, partial [Candidatus Thorarchaeota archaeon]
SIFYNTQFYVVEKYGILIAYLQQALRGVAGSMYPRVTGKIQEFIRYRISSRSSQPHFVHMLYYFSTLSFS